MARTARGFRQDRLRAPRRLTGWDEGPGGTALTTISDSLATILGSGFSFLLDGLTIVRIRGSIQVFLTSGAANSGFHCALGMGVVSLDAFTVGITAVPDPIADMQWGGWMYHRFFDVHSSAAFSATDGANKVQFEIDSKAMRKVGQNDLLFLSLEAVESGTAVMSVCAETRILLKLS